MVEELQRRLPLVNAIDAKEYPYGHNDEAGEEDGRSTWHVTSVILSVILVNHVHMIQFEIYDFVG